MNHSFFSGFIFSDDLWSGRPWTERQTNRWTRAEEEEERKTKLEMRNEEGKENDS